MNPIGLHNGYFLGSGIENVFSMMAAAKAADADVFELDTQWVSSFLNKELMEISRKADDLGLSLSCNGGFDGSNDISSTDTSTRNRGIEHAKRLLAKMSILGISSWSGINYGAWLGKPQGVLTKEKKEEIREISKESLREIVSCAKDHGILYCLEIVNRFEQFLLNTVEEGVAFVRELDCSNVKLLLDSFHMNIEEDDMASQIRYAGNLDLIGEVHVGESNRKIIGSVTGHIDWDSFFGALKDIGYEGLITLESFVIPWTPIASQIGVWRELLPNRSKESLTDDAKNGILFVRRQMMESQ